MSDFAAGSVILTPNPLWQTAAPGQLDLASRLVPDNEPLYRLTWELLFHDGRVVRQYTRCGDQIIQVRLVALDKRGAKELRVWDPLRPRSVGLIHCIPIPPDAVPHLVVTSYGDLGDHGLLIWKKIYSYGWTTTTEPRKCEWHHIDPEAKRIVINNNRNKALPWG